MVRAPMLNAWDTFNDILSCVDEEHRQRAFDVVWKARGETDIKEALGDVALVGRLCTVDTCQRPWE